MNYRTLLPQLLSFNLNDIVKKSVKIYRIIISIFISLEFSDCSSISVSLLKASTDTPTATSASAGLICKERKKMRCAEGGKKAANEMSKLECLKPRLKEKVLKHWNDKKEEKYVYFPGYMFGMFVDKFHVKPIRIARTLILSFQGDLRSNIVYQICINN